jgi:hypothetical protein
MKITVKKRQPRNPYVAAVLFRRAGRHEKSNKQVRAGVRNKHLGD